MPTGGFRRGVFPVSEGVFGPRPDQPPVFRPGIFDSKIGGYTDKAVMTTIVDPITGEVLGKHPSHDPVDHPKHYTSHPSGVECITVTEHMNFNVGNAVKYLWRAGLKSPSALEDLKKARWYVDREIERLKKDAAR